MCRRSLCEADRHPDNGYLNDEVTTVEYVYLETEYLQECPPVQLVGEIGERERFTANQALQESETRPGQLRIVAWNPDHARRTWADSDNLNSVTVQFKPTDSEVWLTATDKDKEDLEIRELENDYGYVTVWWHVADLTPGDYDLRILTSCTASVSEVPAGIESKHSAIATGTVDRKPPVLFGYPEPADGEYKPGDAFAFAFDEPIQCGKPFKFQVELTVDDLDRSLNADTMTIVCTDREVHMALRRGFKWADIAGKSAKVTLKKIKDKSGNEAADFTHTFRFAVIEVESLAVEVNGIKLRTPYDADFIDKDSDAYASLTGSVKESISNATGLPRSRIELNSVVPTDVTAFRAGTTVSVYLLPAFQQQQAGGNNRRRRAGDASQSISASAAADLLGEALVSGGGSGTLSIFSNDTSIQVDIVSSDAAISKHPNATTTTTQNPLDLLASTGEESSVHEENSTCKMLCCGSDPGGRMSEGVRESVCLCVHVCCHVPSPCASC